MSALDTTPLDSAEYVLLTTHRSDGSLAHRPVWMAGADGRYLVVTRAASGKVRQVRADGRVTLTPCDRSGGTVPDAPTYHGTARVLEGDDVEEARLAVLAAYPGYAEMGGTEQDPLRAGLEIVLDR